MSDRAEQAKALIVEANTPRFATTSDEVWCRNGVKPIEQNGLLARAITALTASEAEVTRLETGIAEALEAHTHVMHPDRKPCYACKAENILKALSQPTTDTNGARDV